MEGFGFGILFGLAAAIVVGVLWRRTRRGGRRGPRISVAQQVKQMQSVGQLSVYKVLAKEIVSAEDHRFGESGRKYWSWLFSTKKMVMIFEFDVDFRYDLRDPSFSISEKEGAYTMSMPPCRPEIRLKDLSFYDEQGGEFLPLALPDLISKLLGDRFDVKAKNQLKEQAKSQISVLAGELARELRVRVEESARQTMLLIARGYGVERLRIEFPEPERIEIPEEGIRKVLGEADRTS